jgi:PilZ domain-containing protein
MDVQSKMKRPTIKRDRRRGGDRRQHERFALEQNVSGDGSSGHWEGTMSDISSTGCFILSSGDLEDGDRVRIDIPLIAGGTVSLWGDVVNHVYEIGFGVSFVGLTDAQRSYLERYTDTLRSD